MYVCIETSSVTLPSRRKAPHISPFGHGSSSKCSFVHGRQCILLPRAYVLPLNHGVLEIRAPWRMSTYYCRLIWVAALLYSVEILWPPGAGNRQCSASLRARLGVSNPHAARRQSCSVSSHARSENFPFFARIDGLGKTDPVT